MFSCLLLQVTVRENSDVQLFVVVRKNSDDQLFVVAGYSQGSTDNLKTIASDSGRGNSVESSTKKDAVHGYTGQTLTA